jgi:hypothetical protein
MGVARHRPHQFAATPKLVALHAACSLERAPAEVLGRLITLQGDAVDLLDGVLADVGDPDLGERRIEPEAPGVAQAGDHRPPSRRAVDRRGDELAQPGARVLGGRARIEGSPAVAQTEVQPAVGTECELAAVVVSPPAGRRTAGGGSAPGRSRGPRGTRPPGCRPGGRTSGDRAACSSRSRGGRRSRAVPAPRRPALRRRGRAACAGARPRSGPPGPAARAPTAPRRRRAPTPTHVGRSRPLATRRTSK